MNTSVIRPVLTEKTLSLAAIGWYTFVVKLASRKSEISRDITSLYAVHVTDVHTRRVKGKTRRVGKKPKRAVGPDWKKAMIRLKSGETIEAFQVTTEQAPTK